MSRAFSLFIVISIFATWVGASSLSVPPESAITASAPRENAEDLLNRYRLRIEKTLSDIKAAQRPEAQCQSCQVFAAGREGDVISPACRRTYRELYKIQDRVEKERPEDRDIDMRIAFGYMDFANSVDDYYAMVAFAMQVTSPCRGQRSACGFKENPDDAGDFQKQITMLGPDGKPRSRTVHLRIRWSSATPDERLNRGARKADQDEQTANTRAFFADGLKNADVMMYVGHARDGGGPDFGPPVVNPQTHKTDFSWYHQHRNGLKFMTDALSSTAKPPKLVGIFACYAEDHFRQALRSASPSTGLVLAGQSEFEAGLGQATATLDSLLAFKCESEFKKAVDVITSIETANNYPITSPLVDGLFKK